MNAYCIELPNEKDTLQVGSALAEAIQSSSCLLSVIYLKGDLGMGKTTFSRGFLHAFDYEGRVKSPTYTLVEPYLLEHVEVYHFDLYRLGDPEELEFMGIRDYFEPQGGEGDTLRVCLIEWPEMGAEHLAASDVEVQLSLSDDGVGRKAKVLIGDPSLCAELESSLSEKGMIWASISGSDSEV